MDTALITFTDATTQECDLTNTSSLTVNFTSASQSLQTTDVSGNTTTVDLSTVVSIAFSQSVPADPAPEASDTADAPSDPEVPASTPENSASTPAEPVAPTEFDVTNGEEIVINETDAPVVPEASVE